MIKKGPHKQLWLVHPTQCCEEYHVPRDNSVFAWCFRRSGHESFMSEY